MGELARPTAFNPWGSEGDDMFLYRAVSDKTTDRKTVVLASHGQPRHVFDPGRFPIFEVNSGLNDPFKPGSKSAKLLGNVETINRGEPWQRGIVAGQMAIRCPHAAIRRRDRAMTR